jgi:hypothetical protein
MNLVVESHGTRRIAVTPPNCFAIPIDRRTEQAAVVILNHSLDITSNRE